MLSTISLIGACRNSASGSLLNVSSGGKSDDQTRATILYIRPNNLYYTACPGENCNKKVNDDGDGWRCEKCDRSYPEPVRRYIFSANIADYSGQIWISGFDDIGQLLMGMTADQLDNIRVRCLLSCITHY